MNRSESSRPNETLKVLAEILAPDERILFAYLFGSMAKGRAHPTSDLDVAVFLASFPPGSAGDLEAVDVQIDLARRIARTFDRDVDVVVLNRAPGDLCYTVLTTGILVMCRDHARRRSFQVEQLRLFEDRRVMSRIFDHYRRLRIKEGTFGGGVGHGSQTSRRD